QAEAEPLRMLRANLRYFNVDREIKSVLITSAAPAEGKSTIAMHLAAAAASGGSRVLLIEADLRRPSVSTRLGLPGETGLSQVLAGTREVHGAIQRVRVDKAGHGLGGEDDRTMDVLAAGPLPPNPTDLI